MALGNFPPCATQVLRYEGGNVQNPKDPGGRTSRGVTQRVWNQWRAGHPGLPADVYQAPQSAVLAIYEQNYWRPVAGDAWPKGLDLCVYDVGVNSGPGRARSLALGTLAQTTGNMAQLGAKAWAIRDQVSVIKRFQGRRLAFLHALSTWAYFGKGWGSRVASVEAIATKWALTATGLSPAAVQDKLKEQGKTAGTVSNTAGGTAAAVPAAPAAAVAGTNQAWMDFAVTGALTLATVLLMAYLAHVWYINRQRAEAFEEAANGP